MSVVRRSFVVASVVGIVEGISVVLSVVLTVTIGFFVVLIVGGMKLVLLETDEVTLVEISTVGL